ncbi:MAG TPA: MazG nucleotide pyrophosphohydrolase domain-containing protein [Nevskiaceae bacterium]|nr:MazG nucleotide pyrophosphohydrolase domain-containing protein [Nevskiaceae bacterium]
MSGDPLAEAEAVQRAAAREGFDWPDAAPIWDKLAEEIAELRAALAESPERRRDELGDLLFAVVNLARHLGVDPGEALRGCTARFGRRFAHVIAEPERLPPPGDPARLEAMERRWQQAKRLEREN